jgi:uncharacterized Fe-S cluster-containing radical SAM superfamily protein
MVKARGDFMLPIDVKIRLERVADQRGVSMSAILTLILRKELPNL